MSDQIFIGCAGWSIPKSAAEGFPEEGSHLERYAQRFPAVEINSSFYRAHRPETYARWAGSVPAGFQFSVKMPREITHTRRLKDSQSLVETFLSETAALGEKRGPLLIQLPPSLAFDFAAASAFFERLRTQYDGPAVCEPRHKTWFAPAADALLRERCIARAAADPAILPQAANPGGAPRLVYYRWHGSPRLYYSEYSAEQIRQLADTLRAQSQSAIVWCIFDNTASGAATENALELLKQLR